MKFPGGLIEWTGRGRKRWKGERVERLDGGGYRLEILRKLRMTPD
ncbi:hypothetical protein DFO77_101202 [Marinilabilia salmonicolor]|uniref:Uncharacterized protein n=1 Tax=Marinilabilia salmonicolor TaxID=989 RepID=A0A368VEE6_9BACT|nr:hypothetical protein DFO77_101202 [Marinilabilia salmonicolor]